MKNLKISLTAILAAIILTISTGVYAYDGVMDLDDGLIIMPSAITEGEGTVQVDERISGELSYQFVEIDTASYNEIKQLQEKVKVARLYKIYQEVFASTNGQVDPTDPDYINYITALDAYEQKYNEKLDGIVFTDENIAIWEARIVTLFGSYNEANWIVSTNGKVTIDLTTVKGTVKYVLFVKVTNSAGIKYRADIYEITGKETEKPNNNTITNNPTTENEVINTPTNKITESPKKEETTTKYDDTTSGKTLPKTGVSGILGLIIAGAAGVAGVSYKKYKSIK